MTGLVQRARQKVKRLKKQWDAESSARRFMAFCERKWPRASAPQGDAVVLMGLFAHKIATYVNAHTAQALARRTGARIEAFGIFGGTNALVRRVYASFGAQLALDASFAENARAELEKQADEIFAGLKTKWDLLELQIDGLKFGDLLYDTYLRWFEEPTVKLDDPRLRNLLFESLFVYVATVNYLKTRRVVGFIADDYGYHECGIITRVLMREKVPVYIVCYGREHFLYQLFGEPETGDHNYPVRWPYHHYRSIFRSLPPEEQTRCREKGRAHLEGKLAGQIDRFTLVTQTAYGESDEQVFQPSGKPRILILLHDFIDAPHGFRWMLFPDFYEWICFLLERAGETDFEWYMKPHPGSWDAERKTINSSNVATIERLLARFPKVKFLPPTVSNRQIVKEGINAMFTMYGTGGHEFARLGIPVVNAGDNPHIAYDFNFHPRTTDEYADLISRADRLPLEADHDDIAEYVYMNYFYFRDRCSTGANPLPASFFKNADYENLAAKPDGYDLIIADQDGHSDAAMEKYYDEFFRSNPAVAARA